jgi:hypothetical protein
MIDDVFRSGTFAGVSVSDPCAVAALSETPVTVKPAPVSWPTNLDTQRRYR